MALPILPKIVGILNVTPDSFSDGGVYFTPSAARNRARELWSEGASIVELGAQSTRPGSVLLSADEELARLSPVIEGWNPEGPWSVDTFHADVADFCLKHGASWVNDVSAGRFDSEMFSVLRKYRARLVLMHSKESDRSPHATRVPTTYHDCVATVGEFLQTQIDRAMKAGVSVDQLILDPGFGAFLSSDSGVNLQLLARFGELASHFKSFEILVGVSRKGFLDRWPGHRDAISQLLGLHLWLKGATYLRTHDVSLAQSFGNIWTELSQASKQNGD